MKRESKPWTEEDEERLTALWRQGKTIRECAAILGMKFDRVRDKLKHGPRYRGARSYECLSPDTPAFDSDADLEAEQRRQRYAKCDALWERLVGGMKFA